MFSISSRLLRRVLGFFLDTVYFFIRNHCAGHDTKACSLTNSLIPHPSFTQFIDDVEFVFPDSGNVVQYRSASRIGESDGDINRKRIKAIRESLEAKGWSTAGF